MNACLLLAMMAIRNSNAIIGSDVLMSAQLQTFYSELQTAPTAPATQDKGDAKAPTKAEDKKQEEKKDPYQEAIKDFTKKEGMLTIFQKEDNLLFEIPKGLLGRDFLCH